MGVLTDTRLRSGRTAPAWTCRPPLSRSSGGTRRCASVAAASVLAKVVRDRRMRAEAEHFPAYCFERNKGYPSPTHKAALFGYGLSAIHRRSWSFVRDLPLGGSFGRAAPDRPGEPSPEGPCQGVFHLGRVG